MKVTYSRRALEQLDEIFAYIAVDNPMAAAEVVGHVQRMAALIGEYPGLGRKTDVEGVRVVAAGRYPYVIFYSVLSGDEVRVLRVRHGARSGQ